MCFHMHDVMPCRPVPERLQRDQRRRLRRLLDVMPCRPVPERLQRDQRRRLRSLLDVMPCRPVPERLQRDQRRRLRHLSWRIVLSYWCLGSVALQGRQILRQRLGARDTLPGRLLLPPRVKRSPALPVRSQVPCGRAANDSVRPALLLPRSGRNEPDPLQRGLLLRRLRHVLAEAVPPGDLCVVPGKGRLQQLLCWTLLPECHQLDPLSRRGLLPAGGFLADTLPGGVLLPYRLAVPKALQCRLLLPPGLSRRQSVPCKQLLPGILVGAEAVSVQRNRRDEHLLERV